MTTNQSTYAHSEEAKYIVSLNEKLLDENKKLRQDIYYKVTRYTRE